MQIWDFSRPKKALKKYIFIKPVYSFHHGQKWNCAQDVQDLPSFMTINKMLKGMSTMADKKKKDKDRGKYPLTSTQEVLYQREFKMADRAGGFSDRKTKL